LKKNSFFTRGITVLFICLTAFSSCEKSAEKQSRIPIEKLTFRDVHGVTNEEINAIDALKSQYESFSCAVNMNTDSFLDKNGESAGFAIMFYDWLSNFFGIPFKPEFHDISDLEKILKNGDVDFTIELTETQERRKVFFMSKPIIKRTLKIYRLEGAEPLDDIIASRAPHYAFPSGSVLASYAASGAKYGFETIYVDKHTDAYQLLKSGAIDGYIAMDSTEAAFDSYSDITNEFFMPLIFNTSCLSTGNEQFKPLISVFNKALNAPALAHMVEMRKRGYQKYLGKKLHMTLTEEEKAYIQGNPTVPFAAEFNNYPVSFFDAQLDQWQGIYFDALEKIADITGIKFECVNKPGVQFTKLIDMLENGDALIMSELYRLKKYEGRFLWSDISILSDNFALITKSDFHNIDLNEVADLRVGIRKNTPYLDLFFKMYPYHNNYILYDTQEETWEAVKRGDIDVVFTSQRRLTIFSNFYEDSSYKLNVIFDNPFSTSFGFNKNASVLKSIIDKALYIIQIDTISTKWMTKNYDYRARMAEARLPWLIGLSVSIFFVLLLMFIFFIRSRSIGKQLEKMVKEQTKKLASETSKLQAVFKSIPDLLFCKDTDYKYTQCNKPYADFLGVSEDGIIGKADKEGEWFYTEDMINVHNVEKTVITENRIINFEEKIHSPISGKECIFDTVKAPIILDGEVVGVVSIVRDITRRKEMEEELALKTVKLQMILDTIPDIMFCKDVNLRYTQCNKAFENFWGVRENDMLGMEDGNGKWFPQEFIKQMNDFEAAVINEEKIFTKEISLSAPLTGIKATFESILAPLKQNGNIVGIMCIARDITMRKAMEDEIRAALESKTSFLAHMSHELRTPLNVVIGLTDLILEDGRLDLFVKNNLMKINNAGSTLLNIVNDILDFSKIESGKLEITPVEYYTASVLNDVTTVVITRLGEKPVKFRLNISDDFPEKLFGDDLRVKQILINLLTNAVKYTRVGSIELNIQCERDEENIWMNITVSDTGIGIREDDLKKLFHEYVQVDKKVNRNIEGTGLGLPITKRLVELMSGEIKAYSEYGKGTTFHVRFKQGFISNAQLGAEIVEKLRSFQYAEDKRLSSKRILRLDLSYARVLVVDDVLTNLDVAAGLLRKYRMQVDCLDNGPAAIKRISDGTPVYNAIFMDHMMPDMDGVETVDRIRALGTDYAKNIPIIALTANAIHGTEQMFYKHGFQAFISKPIDMAEMDLVIKKWVRDDSHEDIPVIVEPVYEPAVSIEIEIPGVNTKKGLSLYAGDTSVYLSLLRSYAANTPGLLDKLRIVSEQTLPKYNVTVHGLKGSSAGICAEGIRESAYELERLSKEGNLQGVWALNGKLIADTKIIVSNIKDWLDHYDAAKEKKPLHKTPDGELLKQLRKSCDTYDIKGADKILSILESFDYEEDGDLIPWLRNKIENSDFMEAAQRLENYENKEYDYGI